MNRYSFRVVFGMIVVGVTTACNFYHDKTGSVELPQGELSYANVGRLVVSLPLRDARPQRSVAFTGKTKVGDIRASSEKPTLPLVTWDHVIGPDEAEDLVRKLAAYPTVTAYRAGKSYRGRDVSVLELQLPTE